MSNEKISHNDLQKGLQYQFYILINLRMSDFIDGFYCKTNDLGYDYHGPHAELK